MPNLGRHKLLFQLHLVLLLQIECRAQLQNADHTGGVSVRLTLQQQQQPPPLPLRPEPQPKPVELQSPQEPPKPGQKQLRRGKLTKLLSDAGQEDLRLGWLSVRPRRNDEPVELQPEQQHLLDRQLAAVNASQPSVRGWLMRLAACPGRAGWTDLGIDFWPRWVRNVYCDGGEGMSGGAFCGWPAGLLRCGAQRLQRPRRLQLLHWKCSRGLERQLRRRLRRRQHRQRRDKSMNSKDGKDKKRWSRRMRSMAKRLSVVAGEFECRWAPYEVSVISEVCVCGGTGR